MIYKLITYHEYRENGAIKPVRVCPFLAIQAKKGT